MNFPAWSLAPFVGLLICIAVLPLLPQSARLWERNTVKAAVALGLGIPVALWVWLRGQPDLVVHALGEYLQFIVLIGALFVVSGGIHLEGRIAATPRNNTAILAIGGVLASLIGTTGAAMLLIRPLLATNAHRKERAHTVVFAILVIANCGGLLTPLGDPPLYIGFMRGVPFTWTLALIGPWLFINGMLLLTYYSLDRVKWAGEPTSATLPDVTEDATVRVRGLLNILWLVVIIASVALLGEQPWLRVLVQVAAALGSYLTTSRELRFERNGFTWGPIIEVGALFSGIFLTMVPALEFLREHAAALPLNEFTLFAFSGSLSSVLDNAPTYLTFFEMATQLSVPGAAVIAGVPEPYLIAISLGAVTCGAMTYIGNGPNFMVKAVAESAQVTMPSFTGYIGWTLRYLLPILVSMVLIFIGTGLVSRILGVALALIIVRMAITRIVQSRPREAEVGASAA